MTTFENAEVIHRRLEDLADALELEGSEPLDLLVCGGAALTVMGLVTRATDDIDVLALVLDEKDVAAKPFPEGVVGRATKKEYGELLTVRFLDRYDQIHLKLYAAVDLSGGKHLSDLNQLAPSSEELVDAASWCVQQDPSPGFRGLLEWFLKQEGYDDVVERISE